MIPDDGNPSPPVSMAAEQEPTPEHLPLQEQQPDMEDAAQSAINQIHHRARRGMKALMIRQVGLQVFTFAGGVIIARKLGPGAYGLFGIASFLVTLLAQFGDFGLAPSFIQRKAELTERDLRVGFTLQQILLSVMVVIVLITAPWLTRLYPKAPPETVWLVRALAFSLYLTSWRTMSALQLERNLRYEKLAWIEFLEVVIYQSFAVTLALLNQGTWSYVIATLVTGVVGTFLVYRACPWKVMLEYDGKVAREILRFGIPFQFQSLVNQMGNWVVPLFVGSRLGPSAVGLLIWSSANGKKPLIMIDNVTRVAFPHFSRIQDDRAEVERTVAHYLAGMLALGGLWFALLFVSGPPLIQWIYSGKWVGATTTLALYSLMLSFEIVSFVTSVALNGIGKVYFLARIALARSVLYIAFSVPLVMAIGYNGVPVGMLTAQLLTMPWSFNGLGIGSLRRIMGPIAWVLLPTAASVGVGLAARLVPLQPAVQSVFLLSIVTTVFAMIAWMAAPEWMRMTIRVRLDAARRRSAH